jgi:hypothetical protein
VFRFQIMSAVGNDPSTFERLFAVFRAAATHKTSPTPDVVLYWPELSGEISFEGMLATSVVTPGTSTFADRKTLAAHGLNPRTIKRRLADLAEWHRAYLAARMARTKGVSRDPRFVDAIFVQAAAVRPPAGAGG